jgi:hypothetical protein
MTGRLRLKDEGRRMKEWSRGFEERACARK